MRGGGVRDVIVKRNETSTTALAVTAISKREEPLEWVHVKIRN